MINFDDFKKIDLRVAKVLAAERVEGSEKLIKLRVDIGDPSAGSGLGERQIIAGIGKAYEPEQLTGKNIVIVANLEPRMFTLRHGSTELTTGSSGQVGLESQGMLLAATDPDGMPVLLMPDREVPSGSGIR